MSQRIPRMEVSLSNTQSTRERIIAERFFDFETYYCDMSTRCSSGDVQETHYTEQCLCIHFSDLQYKFHKGKGNATA